MHISSLTIRNFRGVKFADLQNLETTVVVAGPNGCGKSTIFDAIRLLKTVYGEYQPGEISQWFNEFQMPTDEYGMVDLSLLLNDKTKPLEIECKIRFHANEREYLSTHGEKEIASTVFRAGPRVPVGLAAETIKLQQAQAAALVSENLPILKSELAKEEVEIGLRYTPGGQLVLTPCVSASLVFRSYMPRVLGLIDYHSPQRHFQREILQNLNVNLDAHRQQQKQTALYNYQAKYQNVKSELAASYVQDVLAQRAGVAMNANANLTLTLQSLFTTFFPDKQFPGPLPTPEGSLTFQVIGKDGSKHDLNDLSAGEKEILYGYLRIRNSAPRYSIVLLDEPELHLNPGLVRKLPKFYATHLGQALDNQIWLITHSDALIRETLGQDNFSLYHMSSALDLGPDTNQATKLEAEESAEQLVVDLVGDLAAFRPGGKVLIFEGGGDSEYDISLVQKLFPSIQEKINFLSGGGKERVKNLHTTLERASKSGKIPFSIISVTDLDSDPYPTKENNRFQWDVYHIENYLLEPHFMLKALKILDINKFKNEEHIWDELKNCAEESMANLILHTMRSRIGKTINDVINLNNDPNKPPSQSLSDALDKSIERMEKLKSAELSPKSLLEMESQAKEKFSIDLESSRWSRTFRGRDIIKIFAHRHGDGLGYTRLRNMIANGMADANYQPIGMGAVLSKILSI